MLRSSTQAGLVEHHELVNVGHPLRNLWRPVSGVGVLPVLTVLLVGAVFVGQAYAGSWPGLVILLVGTSGLAFTVWRCLRAKATVERGDTLVYDALIGRQRVPLYVARNGVVEDVGLGSRLASLRLGATSFVRQPLAVAAPDQWERLLGPDVSREVSLWRALRRPGG